MFVGPITPAHFDVLGCPCLYCLFLYLTTSLGNGSKNILILLYAQPNRAVLSLVLNIAWVEACLTFSRRHFSCRKLEHNFSSDSGLQQFGEDTEQPLQSPNLLEANTWIRLATLFFKFVFKFKKAADIIDLMLLLSPRFITCFLVKGTRGNWSQYVSVVKRQWFHFFSGFSCIKLFCIHWSIRCSDRVNLQAHVHQPSATHTIQRVERTI